MTITEERPATASPPAARPNGAAEAAPKPPRSDAARSRSVAGYIALSFVLAAALVLGFFGYLLAFSGLSEARAQHGLRQQFVYQLQQALAPTGPTQLGAPVALISIPKLHLKNVVVIEGTTSRQLMKGPGHLPSTVLPGQAGVSTILGKGTTYGAPFKSILTLQPGDKIIAATGQGVSTYVVSSFGDQKNPPPANSANRLLLATGSGGYSPGTLVVVSADLVTPVQDTPTDQPGISRAEQPLARDPDDSMTALAGWSQLLLLTAIVGTWLLHRGPRWPVLICLTPVVFAVVWNVYENAAGLLPNVV